MGKFEERREEEPYVMTPFDKGYKEGYDDGTSAGIRKALAEVEEEAVRTFHNDEAAQRHFTWVMRKVRLTLNAPMHGKAD